MHYSNERCHSTEEDLGVIKNIQEHTKILIKLKYLFSHKCRNIGLNNKYNSKLFFRNAVLYLFPDSTLPSHHTLQEVWILDTPCFLLHFLRSYKKETILEFV